MLRFVPALTLLVLIGPVFAGLFGALLPAFGYLPSLGGVAFSLEPFQAVLATPGIWRSAGLSLVVGLASTLVSLAIVMGVIAGWQGTRFFKTLQSLLSPLLSVPHAAAAFGLAFLIAPSGWLMRLLSPWATGFDRPPDWLIVNDPYGLAIIAGLVAKEMPFLLLVSLAALPQLSAGPKAQLAASFGYGPITGFLKTTFPMMYRQIRLPILAVLAYATSVVDVALILGPTTPPPLSVRLLQWMNDPDIAMRFEASAGAQLQLCVTISAIVTWLCAERLLRSVGFAWVENGRRFFADTALRRVAALAALIMAFMIMAGIAVLAIWSFAGFWRFPDALPGGFTVKSWVRQAPGLVRPLGNTLVIAGLSTVLATGLTLACLEQETRSGKTATHRALILLYLPLIVPQVSFLFGLEVLLLQFDAKAILPSVVLAHVIFVLPYVYLSLGDPWRTWDPRYSAIALSLGQTPNVVFWRVRLPMLLPAILTAAAVGFAVSIGQYLATLLIGAGRFPTITTEAVALASGGDRRAIGVYALIQSALPLIGFGLALLIPAWLYRHRQGMKPMDHNT